MAVRTKLKKAKIMQTCRPQVVKHVKEVKAGGVKRLPKSRGR